MNEGFISRGFRSRRKPGAEIIKLHRRIQTTVIYVTHDQVEAMTMGDRIAVLNEGLIQQLGSPQQLYDHPANLFVAGFIGSPSMNFFPGAGSSRKRGRRRSCWKGSGRSSSQRAMWSGAGQPQGGT